ncbi:hypothetical protein I3F54_13340 [Streptomyces sp. MUM 2J]|nr:hypothetical protein [Streptomyces sp. MUM 2J]
MKRTIRTTLPTTGALITALGTPATGARADTSAPRIDLRVLVVSDGGPAADAIAAEPGTAGMPYTEIDRARCDRPVIDAGYPADTVDGRPRAGFQTIVLPDGNPFAAHSPEMAALAAYASAYGIPQVDAYTRARPGAGRHYPVHGGCSGSADGVRAEVTADGRSQTTASAPLTLTLPASTAASSTAGQTVSSTKAARPAPRTRIPEGVTTPLSPTAEP